MLSPKTRRRLAAWFDPDNPFGALAIGFVTLALVLALLGLVAWVMKALGLVNMSAE